MHVHKPIIIAMKLSGMSQKLAKQLEVPIDPIRTRPSSPSALGPPSAAVGLPSPRHAKLLLPCSKIAKLWLKNNTQNRHIATDEPQAANTNGSRLIVTTISVIAAVAAAAAAAAITLFYFG